MSDFYSDWGMPSWDDVPRWMKIVLRILGVVLVIVLVALCVMALLNLYLTGRPL